MRPDYATDTGTPRLSRPLHSDNGRTRQQRAGDHGR
jgi:hypothetical protein